MIKTELLTLLADEILSPCLLKEINQRNCWDNFYRSIRLGKQNICKALVRRVGWDAGKQ